MKIKAKMLPGQSLLKFKTQKKIQDKDLILFSFLYYIMNLSFVSNIPSVAGHNTSKYFLTIYE